MPVGLAGAPAQPPTKRCVSGRYRTAAPHAGPTSESVQVARGGAVLGRNVDCPANTDTIVDGMIWK